MSTASRAEILEAIAEMMRMQLQRAPDRRLGFEMRVGLNLLDILQREEALEHQAAATESASLHALLEASADSDLDACRAQLCRLIADGSLGMADPALLAHLWQTSLDRLAIDQPGYRWRRS